MDHIVKKLSEIEHAAEAVVEHAELEKSELEERIQNERNQFDKQLEDHTQKELNDIHKGLNLLAHCDQFMDRMSLPGKFLLVLSHNIPSAECRIIVKIIGLRQKYPACQLHLLQ